jgi:uncharacterized protein with GYD domain
MARYLFHVTYTNESWATQIRLKGDVVERVDPLIKACNGRLEALYYAFGDADVVALGDFAKPEDAAAFSIAVSAGGAVKSIKTTALMTVEEGTAAMKRAADASGTYRAPTAITLPSPATVAAGR